MKVKCETCDGTGVISAAKQCGMQDYPFCLQPLGWRRCDNCVDGYIVYPDLSQASIDKLVERIRACK